MMLLRYAVVVVGAGHKDCGADILRAFGSAVLGEN
jgi:hypothetical protein